MLRSYAHSLDWALASTWLVMLILLAVIGLNVYLFIAMPKGFFPQQDTGQLNGGLRADQSISSQAMRRQAAPGWSTSSAPTRRSTRWWVSPAAGARAAASCSST